MALVLIFHRTTHRPVGQRATQNEERDREREDFYLFPSLPLVAVPPITSTLHAAVHYNIIKRLRDQRPAAVGSGATLHLESSARGSRKTPENNGRCITIDVVREGDPPWCWPPVNCQFSLLSSLALLCTSRLIQLPPKEANSRGGTHLSRVKSRKRTNAGRLIHRLTWCMRIFWRLLSPRRFWLACDLACLYSGNDYQSRAPHKSRPMMENAATRRL